MSDTYYQDQVNAAGPWDFESAETMLREVHRACALAQLMAKHADRHRAEINDIREKRAAYRAALHGAGATDE